VRGSEGPGEGDQKLLLAGIFAVQVGVGEKPGQGQTEIDLFGAN
jgi:hypothetical protein